jgi:hypothetical protein
VSGIWSRKFYHRKIWEIRNRIISACEQNGSGIKRLRKPTGSDVDEEMLKWFKEEKSDTLPGGGPPFIKIFVLSNYSF